MAFTHRKTDTSKSMTSKNNASKSMTSKRTSSKRLSKSEFIKASLDAKNFENLTGTVTVQLAEDTNPKSKRVAYGSLVLCSCFTVYINVYEGKNGYFISYPNYADSEGNYHDLAYCFDRDVIVGLTDLITEMIDGDEEDEEDGDLPFEG